MAKETLWTVVLSLSLGACGDDVGDVEASKMIDGHNENPNEVITSLRLTFSPLTGEETFSVSWSDPDLSPIPGVDDIVLQYGRTYRVELEVFNELEIPVEDFYDSLEKYYEEYKPKEIRNREIINTRKKYIQFGSALLIILGIMYFYKK